MDACYCSASFSHLYRLEFQSGNEWCHPCWMVLPISVNVTKIIPPRHTHRPVCLPGDFRFCQVDNKNHMAFIVPLHINLYEQKLETIISQMFPSLSINMLFLSFGEVYSVCWWHRVIHAILLE